jgi:hypothetical protein
MIEKVQIAISDPGYRATLRQMLATSVSGEVLCVEDPDVASQGVLVVDPEHLDRLPFPIQRPERVVLVTRDKPSRLSAMLERAWEAGVHSVVSTQDPVYMVALAVMSANLRVAKALPPRRRNLLEST